jgi:hypothetical protein
LEFKIVLFENGFQQSDDLCCYLCAVFLVEHPSLILSVSCIGILT